MTFDELKTRIEAPDAGGSDSEALTSAGDGYAQFI